MDLRNKRSIRVFVSSTFADMQEERDALVKLFRELDREAERRGVSLRMVDLRWGVTDDQKRNGKVISTCLQEIDNSRPFFIGLIGARYGWTPSEEEIRQNPELTERYPEIADYCREGLSITEMEMRYGTKTKPDNSLFLIKRNIIPENTRHAALIDRYSSDDYPHFNYTGTEELTRIVRNKMMDLLDGNYPLIADMSDLERYESNQQFVANTAYEGYIDYSGCLPRLDEWLEGAEGHLVVAGERGIGKTSLISEWIRGRHFPGYRLIYHFIGNNLGDGSAMDAQTHILMRLEEAYGKSFSIEHHTGMDEDLGAELADAFEEAEQRGDRWLVVLDGLDHIENQGISKLLAWLPKDVGESRFLFTTTTDDSTYTRLKDALGYPEIIVGRPGETGAADLIRRYLAAAGKSLENNLVRQISGSPLFRHPQLLRLLLNELIAFGVHEKIGEFIGYYTESVDKGDFYDRIIKHTEEYYDSDSVRDILILICIAKDGLSEDSLREILGLSEVEFAMVQCGLRNHLVTVNGRIRFADQEFYQVVSSRYRLFPQEDNDQFEALPYIERLIARLESKPGEEEELAYQYYLSDHWEELHTLLLNPATMLRIILHGDRLFSDYWEALMTNTSYTLREYLNVEFSDLPDWGPDEQLEFLAMIVDMQFGDKRLAGELIERMAEYTGEDAISTALNTAHRAQYLIDLGEFEEAAQLLDEALDAQECAEESELSFIYLIEGNLARAMGNSEAALEMYNKACKIEEEAGEEVPWKYINNKGLALIDLEEFNQALPCFEEAMLKIKKDLTDQTVEGAMVYNNMGLCLLHLSKIDESEEMFHRSLTIMSRNLQSESVLMTMPLNNLGFLYLEQGEYEEALPFLEQAWEILEEKTPGTQQHALTGSNLARALDALGDTGRAAAILESIE